MDSFLIIYTLSNDIQSLYYSLCAEKSTLQNGMYLGISRSEISKHLMCLSLLALKKLFPRKNYIQ